MDPHTITRTHTHTHTACLPGCLIFIFFASFPISVYSVLGVTMCVHVFAEAVEVLIESRTKIELNDTLFDFYMYI